MIYLKGAYIRVIQLHPNVKPHLFVSTAWKLLQCEVMSALIVFFVLIARKSCHLQAILYFMLDLRDWDFHIFGSIWTFLKTRTLQLFVPILGYFWLPGFFCSYSKMWNNNFFTKSAKVLLKRNVIWFFLNFGQSSTIICWIHQMHYFFSLF